MLYVSLVGRECFLQRKGDFLAVNGKHRYSFLQQSLVKLVILEELKLDEALDALLEKSLSKDLVIVKLMCELRVAHNFEVQMRDFLELVAILLLLDLRQDDDELFAQLRLRDVAM